MNKDIIKYLNGQMSEPQRKNFEQRLDAEEALSDELMRVVARESFKQDMKKHFVDFEKNASQPSQKILFRKMARIAAIILLFLVPSIYFVFFQQKPGTMITTAYMDYPVPGKHRNGDAVSLPMNDAFEAFERHKFARAARLFENYFETPGKENTSNLYAGISLLQTKKAKNYPRAIACFERVLSSSNPRNEAAEWFLAIGRYELGQKDQARVLFSKIADNPRHFRQAQAREILAEYY